MVINTFSSVSVSDVTDVGSISVYLTSNQPVTVIYNPNQNTYTPDWSTSNLIVTPIIRYVGSSKDFENGSEIPITANGVSITFTKREGSGEAVSLGSGETVFSGALKVSANKLKDVSSRLLTYICDITFIEPESSIPLTTQAFLTFQLMNDATELSDCSIIGENVFKYDTTQTLIGSNAITLSAKLSNVSVVQWQYKKADGTYAAYPTTSNPSIKEVTLKVLSTESLIWNNDMATIKLVTSDSKVFDIHTISKLRDGAPGENTVSAVLSNENHLLPTSSNGSVKSFVGAETEIHVYEGGEDVSSLWTISVVKGNGLSGTYNSSTHVFTPTALTTDASYAEFTCAKTGYANIVKRYTITKQYAGADGNDAVIYSIEPSVLAMNVNVAGEFAPTHVAFNGYKTIGNNAKTTYSGRFIISESTDGSTFISKYTSSTDEHTKTYTPSSNTIKAIRCILYSSGGTTSERDVQTIIVTRDGKNGIGTNGEGGTSVIVGNESEIIPCTSGGTSVSAKDITIPFYGYKGTARSACTCTVGALPNGMTIKSNTNATTNAGGSVVIAVAAGSSLGNASLLSGDISLTFVCNGTSIEKKFTWAKNIQSKSAVLFQLYSPDGGTIHNSENNTTLGTTITEGSSQVSASSYKWYQYKSSYILISGATSSTLEVTPSMVDGIAWFKCVATYNGVDYTAYYTVNDISDPVQSYTYTTISQYKNGQGEGAVYTRVYRNGVEIDPIRSVIFSVTPPATANSGDFYYKLDKAAKTCTLQKYNGTTWVNATETDILTYDYYRTNGKGVEIDKTQPFKTQRCFYHDASIIDGSMQFRCHAHN